MLGLLRAEPDTEAAVEPQPGLDDLEPLAERLRHAGLPVELSIEGEPRPVPAGVALTAYRVAQEALTNVLKHTADSCAQITLVYGSEALELSVTNDGRATTNGAGAGHGLIGMRERVGIYGGELEAAPLAGGGFRVLARLPYA
jgi:signal transduction histidine kinase